MTCKDCICSEVCYYKSFNDVRNLKKRRDDVEKICKSFVHRDSVKGVEIDPVKKQNTMDAVEVVRCGKCKHWDPDSGYCQFWHGIRRAGHYCGEGERK